MTPRLQSGLSDLQRIRLVLNGLAQQIDIAFDIEDLLLRTMQMHLDVILCLGHLAGPPIQSVIRLTPVVPYGCGNTVYQRVSVAAQLDGLAALRLGSASEVQKVNMSSSNKNQYSNLLIRWLLACAQESMLLTVGSYFSMPP